MGWSCGMYTKEIEDVIESFKAYQKKEYKRLMNENRAFWKFMEPIMAKQRGEKEEE